MLANIIRIGLPLVVMGTMFTQGLRLKLGGGLDFQGPSARDVALACCRSCAGPYRRTGSHPSTPAFAWDGCQGLAILAASPAATFQLRNIYKKGGSPAYLGALHLSLALLAIITVPAVLYLLSEALGFQAEVSVFQVGKTVVQAVLLPVVVGMVLGAVFPKLAGQIRPPLSRIFEIGLVAVAVLLVIGTS